MKVFFFCFVYLFPVVSVAFLWLSETGQLTQCQCTQTVNSLIRRTLICC